MTDKEQHLQQLSDIRNMMERSSRFISLSGLSGIFAGIVAIIGAVTAKVYLGEGIPEIQSIYLTRTVEVHRLAAVAFLLIDAAIVFSLAVGFGIFFTTRRAKQKGLPIWDNQVKRLLLNLAIPLATGAFFCLLLFIHDQIFLIAPATLIFYGLALVNASSYTLSEVRYLGLCEIALGLIGSIFIGYGFISWVIGFGVLHIVYGGVMYLKYER